MKRLRRLTSLLLSLLLMLSIALFTGAVNASENDSTLQESIQTIFTEQR